MSLKEGLKELHARMDQIPRAPTLLKGSDSQRYAQQSYKPSTMHNLIQKRFQMSDIPKYNGTKDPNEHISPFTIAAKGNDITKIRSNRSIADKSLFEQRLPPNDSFYGIQIQGFLLLKFDSLRAQQLASLLKNHLSYSTWAYLIFIISTSESFRQQRNLGELAKGDLVAVH
ncbi:hypothetical protein HAX54_003427 [Datura stramonium]|uniref:Uncharacterized protein n=1 Tax=Datura stramonium TaxID=4076 RepID=A0ABS8T635_DATST|nr:hypothetical protein [Datura stramonium]